jgi:hypothetical protein
VKKILFSGIIFISFYSFSQNPATKIIRGRIVDSESKEGIEGAFVVIKHQQQGTLTEKNGEFLMEVKPSDTLVVNHITYVAREWPVLESGFENNIYLEHRNRLLPDVTVTAPKEEEESKKEEEPRIQMMNNSDYLREYYYDRKMADMDPHYNRVSVIGPHLKIPIARGGKHRKSLKTLKSENERQAVFMQVITDDAVKARLMAEFSMTESEYYAALESFNRDMTDLHYSDDRLEIITALFSYFEKYRKKK